VGENTARSKSEKNSISILTLGEERAGVGAEGKRGSRKNGGKQSEYKKKRRGESKSPPRTATRRAGKFKVLALPDSDDSGCKDGQKGGWGGTTQLPGTGCLHNARTLKNVNGENKRTQGF